MKAIIKSVAIWGDSILRGVIYNAEKCRYTLTKENAVKLVERLLGLTLTNRSTMGQTITQGGETLQTDLSGGGQWDVALIGFGGNDCDFNWGEIAQAPEAEHQPKTPLHAFEGQLRSLIAKVRAVGMRPLLMTLPPLHAQRYFDFITRDGGANEILHWLGGDVQRIYRWHEHYSLGIMKVAAETESPIVDVRSEFLIQKNYENFLCADGIHPNERGQALIADTFVSFATGV